MLLLKLSLRPWRLAPYSQLFSGLAVGFLLVLAGFLLWMQQGLKPVLARLQNEQVITAYLDPSVEPSDEAKVVDSIRTNLGAQGVRAPQVDIELVDQKQFVDRLKQTYPELAQELEDLGGEMAAVVPRYVAVSGIFPDTVLGSIKAVPGVESAETSKDRHRQVLSAFSTLSWVVRVLVVGLALALFTGLIHLSRTNAFLHRDVMGILRLWGAHEWMLKVPALLSSLSVGLLGGTVASITWFALGGWLSRNVKALSPMLRDLPMIESATSVQLLIAGAMIGLMAGVFGGFAGSAFSNANGRSERT